MSESNFKVSVITSCFKGETYLSSFINQLKFQSFFPVLMWILVHNEPSPREIEIVKEFSEEFPGKIKHIIRNSVEPLGASWNRGWKTAETEYICFWNLDDCRPYDSLQRQVEALGQNPECVMAYGDFMVVPQYAAIIGKRIKTIPYNSFLFQRRFPGGAFMVWRRKVSDRIGYFDEQLQTACDYDLVTRAAVSGMKMCKTSGLVGYFTNESKGLSTQKGVDKEMIERTVVQLRYGMFDKIISKNIFDSGKYRISEILVGNNWLFIGNFVKDYALFINHRMLLQKFAGLRRLFMKLFQGVK
jgi:glycosyltransferase involved in cell wall biosynthesis